MPTETEAIQTASLDFFGPITVAYVGVGITWLLMRLSTGKRWPDEASIETERKWLDLLLVFLAIAGVFAVGAAYRNDLLIPKTDSWLDSPITTLNLCLPYAPVFAVLILRRQTLATVWISTHAIHWKLLTGLVASAVGVILFISIRGEWSRLPKIGSDSMTVHSLIHAPAVFLEALAVAFLSVRLKWVTGSAAAILMGSLLFAAAHIPSGTESGRDALELTSFFVFNTALAVFIFGVVVKSKDVIWIAVPHYFLDVAIGAFE